MSSFEEKAFEANRKVSTHSLYSTNHLSLSQQVQDLFNQLKGLITERSRKQKLKSAFDHAMVSSRWPSLC